MDLNFVIFNNASTFKAHNAISYEYNQLNQNLYKKYMDKFAESGKNPSEVYTKEENTKLQVLERLIEMGKGADIPEMYGDEFASMVVQYFRTHQAEKWEKFIHSKYSYFELNISMIQEVIDITRKVLENPSLGFEIFPPLDTIKCFNDNTIPEKYRYSPYIINNGEIIPADEYNTYVGHDIYIKTVEKIHKGFKFAKELLNAKPDAIIAYLESL